MEHKRKSVATENSKATGACVDDVLKLFTLPEEVSHHILSFLTVKDLVRFGGLSKRCNQFQMTAPSVNFEGFPFLFNREHVRLLSCLDRFLVTRGSNKIRSFRIHWSLASGKTASLYNELYRVMTWVHVAVKCNVEVLDLNLKIPDGTTFELPSCLFGCGSLSFLLVECNKILTTPSVACSSRLQSARLRNVKIDEGFCKWILSSCKFMKELHYEQVEVENITIESSSLESFSFVFPSSCGLSLLKISGEKLELLKISGEKLENIVIEWRSDLPSNTSLNVSATNLKSLKWIGNLSNHQILGTFNCLEKAEIFLIPPADIYDFDNGFEVLCSISKAKALILSEKTAEALYKEGHFPQFDYISHFSMHIRSLDDDVVTAMVSLMNGMPNLHSLNLMSNHASYERNAESAFFELNV